MAQERRALASHQCVAGSIPSVDAICGLSLLLGRYFALRGSPVFPSPQKPTFPNFDSTRNQVDQETLSVCATSKLFIICYLFPGGRGGVGGGGGLKVLTQDIRHLCALLRTDGIKVMSRVFSGDKQVIKFANSRNRG